MTADRYFVLFKNDRYFCGSVETHQKNSRSFFLRAKIAAIFTVYIGPRENDDKKQHDGMRRAA